MTKVKLLLMLKSFSSLAVARRLLFWVYYSNQNSSFQVLKLFLRQKLNCLESWEVFLLGLLLLFEQMFDKYQTKYTRIRDVIWLDNFKVDITVSKFPVFYFKFLALFHVYKIELIDVFMPGFLYLCNVTIKCLMQQKRCLLYWHNLYSL